MYSAGQRKGGDWKCLEKDDRDAAGEEGKLVMQDFFPVSGIRQPEGLVQMWTLEMRCWKQAGWVKRNCVIKNT